MGAGQSCGRVFLIFRMLVLLLAVGLAAAESGPGSGVARPAGASRGFADRNPRYRIQVSDVLQISFRFTPEFNQTLTVQPDGFISLLDVGDLKVKGLNVNQVREAIVERYAGILKDPVLTVVLKEFSKPYFIVGGEVKNPGRFALRDELSVSDAIAMAGGFTIGARSTEVLLFRRFSSKTVEVKKINVKMAQNGRAEMRMELKPGDSVFVPRSKVGKLDRFMSVTRLGFYFPMPVF